MGVFLCIYFVFFLDFAIFPVILIFRKGDELRQDTEPAQIFFISV